MEQDLFSQFIKYEDSEEALAENNMPKLVPKTGFVLNKPLTKEEERKIKNRAAALASRQKKKEKLGELESLVGKLMEENAKLKRIVSSLRSENEELKRHGVSCRKCLVDSDIEVAAPMSPISLKDDDFLMTSTPEEFSFFSVHKGGVLAFTFFSFLLFAAVPFLSLFSTPAVTIASGYQGRTCLSLKSLISLDERGNSLISGVKLLNMYKEIKSGLDDKNHLPMIGSIEKPLLSSSESQALLDVAGDEIFPIKEVRELGKVENTFVCTKFLKLSSSQMTLDPQSDEMSLILPIGFIKSPSLFFESKRQGNEFVKLDLRIINAEIVGYSKVIH